MKTLLAVLLLLCLALPAVSGDLAALYAGANVAFLGGDGQYAALEADLNGKVSLSGHLSLVGSVAYGVADNYWRSAVGGRVTSTDIENPNFSVGLGIQHRDYGLNSLNRGEWAPDVSIGYRPWPYRWPRLIVGAQGWYGLESNEPGMELAGRIQFRL